MIKKFISRLFIIILIVVILFSGYNILKELYKYWQSANNNDKIRKEVIINKTEDDELKIDWDKLTSSICTLKYKSWIRIKDTKVNYPVVQTTNNYVLLRSLLNGKYSDGGTIFIDSVVEKPYEDFNTIIYGHNMFDGSMFSPIGDYIRKENFYRNHKNIEIYTPNHKYYLKLFTGFVGNAEDEKLYKTVFNSDEEKEEYIKYVSKFNQIKDIDNIYVQPSDKLVLLSTCVDMYSGNRYVIIGKLVEDI